MSDQVVVAGVEGGATHSTLMIFDGKMKTLATIEGPSTNIFQLGHEETCKRIFTMIEDALKEAKLDAKTKLKSVGLSLSGCEREETNKELIGNMKRLYPDLCDDYAAVSDTMGTLATASGNGGIVLIAGTGSNALLVNPDGSTSRCGGWGHLLGDEASGFWIAMKAVKTYFDHEDKKIICPHPMEDVKNAIFEYFNIKDRFDLLVPCYESFKKEHIAGLCKSLADLASKGDPLCKEIFAAAGKELAMHLLAMTDEISEELVKTDGGLPVVCIGSIWKAWEHLKSGFIQELRDRNNGRLKEVQLLALRVGMPVGACYLGAKAANFEVPRSYSDNTVKFHHETL